MLFRRTVYSDGLRPVFNGTVREIMPILAYNIPGILSEQPWPTQQTSSKSAYSVVNTIVYTPGIVDVHPYKMI